MDQSINLPRSIGEISELHKNLNLPRPKHPLISLINVAEIDCSTAENSRPQFNDFYVISIKKGIKEPITYGQSQYDFDKGIMFFVAPRQVVSGGGANDEGWMLLIHPDFLQGYPLANQIKEYGFFSYATDEALHLSEEEEKTMESVLKKLRQEYQSPIDEYSQDIMIAHIELLLTYSNRFYNRQFISRKPENNRLLTQLNRLLDDYFAGDYARDNGLPNVQFFARELAVSPDYLSDMLRSLTGKSTQQHIHDKLIETAKEKLSITDLSVSEIAYHLGFEHSQSFSRLLKNKTGLSPTEFRKSVMDKV